MFSLVKFTDDNIHHVCKSHDVKFLRNKLVAPFRKKNYECVKICSNNDKLILEQISWNESLRIPQVFIAEKLTLEIPKVRTCRDSAKLESNLSMSLDQDENSILMNATLNETLQILEISENLIVPELDSLFDVSSQQPTIKPCTISLNLEKECDDFHDKTRVATFSNPDVSSQQPTIKPYPISLNLEKGCDDSHDETRVVTFSNPDVSSEQPTIKPCTISLNLEKGCDDFHGKVTDKTRVATFSNPDVSSQQPTIKPYPISLNLKKGCDESHDETRVVTLSNPDVSSQQPTIKPCTISLNLEKGCDDFYDDTCVETVSGADVLREKPTVKSIITLNLQKRYDKLDVSTEGFQPVMVYDMHGNPIDIDCDQYLNDQKILEFAVDTLPTSSTNLDTDKGIGNTNITVDNIETNVKTKFVTENNLSNENVTNYLENDCNNNESKQFDDLNDPDYCPNIESDNSIDYDNQIDNLEKKLPINEKTSLHTNSQCQNYQNDLIQNDQNFQDKNVEPIKENVTSRSNGRPKSIKVENQILIDVNAINKSPLGEALSNPTKTEVSSSKDRLKKYSCSFCKKKYVGKITDHWFQVHKKEPIIQKILSLPPAKRVKGEKLNEQQLERERLISGLRKGGSFKNNCKTDQHFEVVRRFNKNQTIRHVSDFRVCPFCFGFYALNSIRKHFPKCAGIEINGSHHTKVLHNLMIGDVHPEANIFIRKIITRLNNDEIAKVAKHDLLIILYGNYEAFKYRSSCQHNKQIRNELRLLARILIKMRQLSNGKITDLASIFDPVYVKIYITCANELGNFNETLKIFETPSAARDVGRIIPDVCNLWIGECIERKLPLSTKKNAEDFLHLHNLRFPKLISKTVSESQTKKDLEKGLPQLPALDDIKRLTDHVTHVRDTAYETLMTEGFSCSHWITLVQSNLVSILIFNRKRPGEVSLLKIDTYKKSSMKIDETTNPDLFNKMTKEAKKIAAKYTRVITRGKKKAKKAPILMDEKMVKCNDVILQYRNEAAVPESNPYLFGLPNAGTDERWAEGSVLLARYSTQCNARIPHLLRGTRLRKHIATVGVALNLTDGQINDLSKFMGHDKDIHVNIYQQPVGTKDILEISKLLEYAQGDFINTVQGNVLIEEESVSDMEEEDTEQTQNLNALDTCNDLTDYATSTENNDHLKTSKALNRQFVTERTPGQKRKWDSESSATIRNAFLDRYQNKEKISCDEMNELINSHDCLRGRRPDQIRSYLQWYIKKFTSTNIKTKNSKRKRSILSDDEIDGTECNPDKKNNAREITERNRIPKSIYSCFNDFIEKKEIPDVSTCSKAYEKSPKLAVYNPVQIQDFIKRAIQFDLDTEL